MPALSVWRLWESVVGIYVVLYHVLVRQAWGEDFRAPVSKGRTEGASLAGDDLFLVGLLDGSLNAIDPETGAVLWRYDSGSPMLSVKTLETLVPGQRSTPTFFPGADGGLYHYKKDGGHLEKLPLSVIDIAEQSPSITGDGAPVLGERHSSILFLHRRTGQLLSSFHTSHADTDAAEPFLSSEQLQHMRASDVLAVGRVSYAVEAKHALSRETIWNVTFSHWQHVPLPGTPHTAEALMSIGEGKIELYSEAQHGFPHVAGQPFGLRVDARSLARLAQTTTAASPLWSRTFTTAPTFLVASVRQGHPRLTAGAPAAAAAPAAGSAAAADLPLQPDQLAASVSSALAAAALPLRPGADGRCGDGRRSPVVVGDLNGSRYALPVVPPPEGTDVWNGTWEGVVAVRPEDGGEEFGDLMCPLGRIDAPDAIALPQWLPQLPPPAPPPLPPAGALTEAPWPPATVLALLVAALAATFATAYVLRSRARVHQRTAERLPDGSTRIGNLLISTEVLGHGSSTHGTVVFAGVFGGVREVAVKRVLAQFTDVAEKEFEALIKSDEHPNVLRCFDWERAGEFVYLALEKCARTLYDALEQEDMAVERAAGDGGVEREAGGHIDDEGLWAIARDAVEGVHALHQKGIVHRDLKPQNVLLTATGQAKVSDMGLSKTLPMHVSSFVSNGGFGSSGWQAPEQIRTLAAVSDGGSGSRGAPGPSDSSSRSTAAAGSSDSSTPAPARQSKAVDIFSLGLVLFWTLTRGGHPFGADRFARDGNILRKEPDLSAVSHNPELENLLAAMLHRDPKQRPDTAAIRAHPAWWNRGRKLDFLLEVSDRFELMDRVPHAVDTLAALEGTAASAFPPGANWAANIEPQLLNNLYQYRRYKPHSVRDLLRVIRNKANHFRELSPPLQALVGEPPDGYYTYFSARFPRLLLTMLFFVSAHGCLTESAFAKFTLTATDCDKFAAAHAAVSVSDGVAAAAPLPPAADGGSSPLPVAVDRSAQSLSEAGVSDSPTAAATGHLSPAVSNVPTASGLGPGASSSPSSPAMARQPHYGGMGPSLPELPPMQAQFGGGSPYAPAPPPPGNPPPRPQMMPVGWKDSGSMACRPQSFPRNFGALLCDFYVRTGNCKYGDACFKDHPPQYQVMLNLAGFPFRPGTPLCQFYMQKGTCEFGAACKFHHPNLEPVYATAGAAPPRPYHPPPPPPPAFAVDSMRPEFRMGRGGHGGPVVLQ